MSQRRATFILAPALVVALGAGSAGAEPSEALRALVHEVFAVLQPKSFAANREYCGFILRDGSGALVATPPARGQAASCAARWPGEGEVIASYHTHAAHVPGDWGEVPSDIDMRSDRAMGIDGFVSTPGGRLWYVNSRHNTARQLCDPGCMPVDPGFVRDTATGTSPAIARKYSYLGLLALFAR